MKTSNIFDEYLKHAIETNFTRKRIRTATKSPKNKWFNEQWKIAKISVNDFAKKHNISVTPYREHLKTLQAEYYRIKQLKRRIYEQSIQDKLGNMLNE